MSDDSPGLWARTAYMAANDITTVAIYRLASGVMAVVLLGLLSYFGSRLVAAEDRNGTDLTIATANIASLRGDMADFKSSLVMSNSRADYFADRLNALENRMTAVEVRAARK